MRTAVCSYCGEPLPHEGDHFVPLILWNGAGWVAEFCDHCQEVYFGVQSFPAAEEASEADVDDA